MIKTYTFSDAIAELTKENPTNFSFDNETNEISEWDIGDNPSGATQPTSSEIQNKLTELQSQAEANETAQANLKASAKAKLIAGEALTEDEANTIVL
jgi:Cu2+-containing amine oxidase